MKYRIVSILIVLFLTACGRSEEEPEMPSTASNPPEITEVAATTEVDESSLSNPTEEPANLGETGTDENISVVDEPTNFDDSESAEVSGTLQQPSPVNNPGLTGQIIFQSLNFNVQEPAHLYIMNADGSQTAQLIESPAHYSDINWHPASRRLGMIVWEDGWQQPKPFLLDVDNAGAKTIESGLISINEFDFLPNGNEIIFDGYDKSTSNIIYHGELQTGTVTELVRTSHGRGNPSVSPSGRYVAYDCGSICILDFEQLDSQQRMDRSDDGQWILTDSKSSKVSVFIPAWATVGDRLAFVYDNSSSDEQEICVFDFTESSSRCWPLGTHVISSTDSNISWSPDSEFIAYNAKDKIKSQGIGATLMGNLFAVNVNSGDIINLTNSHSPQMDSFPLWIDAQPPLPIPIARSSPFTKPAAESSAAEPDPAALARLDQLGAEETLRALIQAFANDDRPTFYHLIEGVGAPAGDVWEKMGEGCRDFDATQLSFVDTEEACCTDSLIELMVLNGDVSAGAFTLHRGSDDIWKVLNGRTNCGQ